MGDAQDAIAAVNLSEGGSPLDDGALDKAAAELEAAAAEGRDAVALAGKGVADVSFLPWHTSLIEAQSAYLDHNQAWVNYLDAGARNAASLANSPLDIETTWRIAEVRVREAIPFVPFPGINAHGPLVTISDFGNNHGLVVGDAIPDWRNSGFLDWPVTLSIDGVEIGAATARTMLDGPVGAARFLFETMAARGIALRPGQWISSGAVTGVHEVSPQAKVTATFGTMRVSCTIEAARPAA